ncbi:MAG: T9SS type A sorting domain-containing protein [Bacteroidetes bacterium]|nr:T9SS type A sorting domain-containing protein [Bacteroidota bacterium]MBU1115934.1 T9SS type A sorting domain-containing protein [Bacteroidota bacterium]MBU1798469.1 T9SS type A sorting domain-containing protein [Bacteroidota bacterium]
MKHIILFLLLISTTEIFGGGVVYIVLGSDTAIWEGMGTSTFNDFYKIDLFTNSERNTYKVMDPAFRAQFKDSYGTPLKMTWWMMAGNIFRYAKNKNMPVPNIMTLYLMKKYHGENVTINGDELSLHYHTFLWSDYDGDGVYYWNQAKTFLETLDDFKYTLSQFLLEEETFPVSFRSGWHYMDNDWQQYLDQKILPYSMHNDYPAKRIFDEEPIDNIFDWSEATSEWIPYHPSYSNYQVDGTLKGWNLRSAHFSTTISRNYFDSIFAKAKEGTDQVACIWGHLPEVDFLENIEKLDILAHQAEAKYGVEFRYCTAIEAMQLWRGGDDSDKPQISITEKLVGSEVFFEINSNETIFQSQPFVAIKDINEKYFIADCIKIDQNNWRTNSSYLKKDLVKVGVTVCDTLGNQAMDFIEYLPADVFVDNLDAEYSELYGNWNKQNVNSWGIDSRIASITETDFIAAQWKHLIPKSTYYNLFIQVPEIINPVEKFEYVVYTNSNPIDTIKFTEALKPLIWIYVSTLFGNENDEITVEFRANGKSQGTKNAVADVLKISALVKAKELSVNETILDLNEIVIGDTVSYPLIISNYGINNLNIFGINSLGSSMISKFSFPIEIPKMSSVEFNLKFCINQLGDLTDSLLILSDDPVKGKYILPISAFVQNYFTIVDNEDHEKYSEFGEWTTSVATANGSSSRYAKVNSNPKSYALFQTKLLKSGKYNIFEIVPTTVNACDRALYQVSIGNIKMDSLILNQNEGSGSWKLIGSYYLPENIDITVKVSDIGESTPGFVLRADAFKFQLIEELTDLSGDENLSQKYQYKLNQNYPNPFNTSTTITFEIPKSSNVRLEIFNLLGEKVNTLINENLIAGTHSAIWKGENNEGITAASGIYFYRLKTNDFFEVKKMIYLH